MRTRLIVLGATGLFAVSVLGADAQRPEQGPRKPQSNRERPQQELRRQDNQEITPALRQFGEAYKSGDTERARKIARRIQTRMADGDGRRPRSAVPDVGKGGQRERMTDKPAQGRREMDQRRREDRRSAERNPRQRMQSGLRERVGLRGERPNVRRNGDPTDVRCRVRCLNQRRQACVRISSNRQPGWNQPQPAARADRFMRPSCGMQGAQSMDGRPRARR